MSAAGLSALVALALGGVLLVVIGCTRAAPAARTERLGVVEWVRRHWANWTPLQRRLLFFGCAAGVGVFVFSGWLPALVLLPLALVTIPRLLSDPPEAEIEVLEALDRWVRLLGASLSTGKSIADAIRSTRHQVPARLYEPVTLLAARLDERWPLSDALYAFAEQCAAADVDAVVAALVVAARRGGQGAPLTLAALADAVQDRLDAARELATERAKPRIVARQITAITLGVVTLAVLSSPEYFAAYRSGLGALILGCLVAAYLGCLYRLRSGGLPPPRERMLQAPSREAAHV